MSSSTTTTVHQTISITDVSLIAREQPVPPFGTPIDPNRPIGIASVFLTIQNPLERQQSLTVESVKVVNAGSEQVELVSDTPQQVTLMPLEQRMLDIQLTNHTGYKTKGRMKAIATYRVDNNVHFVESPVVELMVP